MRKLFAFVVLALSLQTLAFAQCPDAGITAPGFHPPADQLTPIERGGATYNETVQVNIPGSFDTTIIIPVTVTIDSIVVDSISGQPSGIAVTCDPSDCTFNGGTAGCINFTGTTNDPIGQYDLTVQITAYLTTPLGPRVESLEMSQLGFSYYLTVVEAGALTVTVAADPPAICRGESTVFTASVTNGSGNQTYLWSSGVTDSSFTTTPVGGGGYSVTVIDGTDTVTASGSVMINDAPVAAFTLSDAAMPTITFDNTSTGATSYAWDFDDGSTGVDAEPVHVYDENGTFTVQLVATNSCGNDTATADVTITGVFIGTLEDDLGFSVYPNPSAGIFTISLAGNTGKPTTINVFDQSGKNVFSEILSGTVQKQMNLTDLPKGVYTLHLNSEKSNGVQKLVIR